MEKRLHHSFWELSEHALQSHDENPLPTAALDELGGEDAGFEGLAQAVASAIRIRERGWRSACRAGSS